jgi:hypothetical protein
MIPAPFVPTARSLCFALPGKRALQSLVPLCHVFYDFLSAKIMQHSAKMHKTYIIVHKTE